MGSKMKIVGYIRVSTEEQAREGVSLENQLSRLRAYAALHGHELVDVYEDRGGSGRSMARLGVKAALAALDRGDAEGLLVSHLDRLSRNLRDVLFMVDSYFGPGCAHSLLCIDNQIDTSTPTGRMVIAVLATIAQWQREEDVERIKRALAHKKAKGELVGSVPWGWRLTGDGKTLEPNAREAEVMMVALDLQRRGMKLRAIGAQLRARGYRNRRRSTVWNPKTVARLIRVAREYEGSEAHDEIEEEKALAAEMAAGLIPDHQPEHG